MLDRANMPRQGSVKPLAYFYLWAAADPRRARSKHGRLQNFLAPARPASPAVCSCRPKQRSDALSRDGIIAFARNVYHAMDRTISSRLRLGWVGMIERCHMALLLAIRPLRGWGCYTARKAAAHPMLAGRSSQGRESLLPYKPQSLLCRLDDDRNSPLCRMRDVFQREMSGFRFGHLSSWLGARRRVVRKLPSARARSGVRLVRDVKIGPIICETSCKMVFDHMAIICNTAINWFVLPVSTILMQFASCWIPAKRSFEMVSLPFAATDGGNSTGRLTHEGDHLWEFRRMACAHVLRYVACVL